MKFETDIVVIDSGVDYSLLRNSNNINGIAVKKNDFQEHYISDDIRDQIGHGTAVCSVIIKESPSLRIFMIKLFDTFGSIDLDDIIYALTYIKNNIKCKVINMSFGVSYCEDISYFEKICKELIQSGIIIVSAYDNLGTISYPAFFDDVIGVDISLKDSSMDGYTFNDNSPVNITFHSSQQLLPWKNGELKTVEGSSFYAPKISTMIAKKYPISDVWDYLKLNATNYRSFERKNGDTNGIDIKKAIVFPFNKEIRSIAANEELCNFDIVGYFDSKYTGNVGKQICSILNYTDNEKYILNVDNIDWNEDFDTVILGHTTLLDKITKKNYLKKIVSKCSEYQKKIYSFEKLDMEIIDNLDKKVEIKYPNPNISDYCNTTFGKLHCINKPILSILGTSSKQGKFSLQLQLRKKFIEMGYTIGQLGTEPSSLLLGFDKVFPMGYGSNLQANSYDSVYLINHMMGQIEKNNPDLIIVGGQSQTLHSSNGNLSFYSMENIELLLATSPDGVVLVINIDDPIDYINRTINFIECIQETKVLCLICYPINNSNFALK